MSIVGRDDTTGEGDPTRTDTESLLGDVIEAIPDGMAIVGDSGEILLANRALSRLLGLDADELRGRSLAAILPDLALGGPAQRDELETRLVRPDGGEVPVAVWLGPIAGAQGSASLVVRDATEQHEVEDRLRLLSDHDPLTGMLNRRRFELDAEKEHARSSRYGGGAMLVLGLDNFKHLNQALGHRNGDLLLCGVAGAIVERIRETDVVARLGGDQFAVLLSEVDADRALAIGDDIAAIVAQRRFDLDGRSVSARLSGGVVTLDAGSVDASEAMGWAELAMRQAKLLGGGRVVAFEPSLLPDQESYLSWTERIRAALDADAFVPYFQPILDLADDTVTNYELLIRMRNEAGELIPPDSFMPTAERFGLVGELDRWVVRAAVEALRKRSDRPDLQLEVNLSGRSIGDPGVLETIRGEIERSGVDPRRLIFEITETAAIASLEDASRFGRELLEMGCGFALDDFGTGFASFYYLKRIPLTHLKIDGEFIRALATSPVDRLVVKAIVDIAHGMGLRTVAEYVEDATTLETVRELGLDYCQGFEVGVPEPPGEPGQGLDPA